jgi:capsular exopolysaccharide synthesis family protein
VDLKRFVDVLRSHWLVILVTVAVCTGSVGAFVWSQTPTYTARTQLFVSTPTAPGNLSLTYQGGLFSQQRVLSYSRIVSSPEVVRGVIESLHLPMSVEQLQGAIHASVPVDTILIDVTVEDSSPQRAAAIANEIGLRFPRFVSDLETPPGRERTPVKVSVTSPAEVPTSPSSPRKKLGLAIAALLGLGLGIGFAGLRSLFDTRIRSASEASYLAGAPVLGSVPNHSKAHKRPLAAMDISSAASEAYRRLRTNLRFLGVEGGRKAFVVASALPEEGKTLIVANLGIAFAQAGYRVALVDGDLRRPRLAETLGLSPKVGLTDVLTRDLPIDAALQRWSDGLSLSLLASGPLPRNPSELLGGQGFAAVLGELERRYDVVIVDSPALLLVTDAAILAQVASRVVLVTRLNSTRADQLESAVENFRVIDTQIAGVVLNRSRKGSVSPYRSRVDQPSSDREIRARQLAPDAPARTGSE